MMRGVNDIVDIVAALVLVVMATAPYLRAAARRRRGLRAGVGSAAAQGRLVALELRGIARR